MPADGSGQHQEDAELTRRRGDRLARQLQAAESVSAWRFRELADRGRRLMHLEAEVQAGRRLASELEIDVRRLNVDVQALLRRAEAAEAEGDRLRAAQADQIRRAELAEAESQVRVHTQRELEAALRHGDEELSAVRSALAVEQERLAAALEFASVPLGRRLRWWLVGQMGEHLPAIARRPARIVWWMATGQLAARLAKRARLRREARTIAASAFFDAAWYSAQHAELASNADPALHYLLIGAPAGAAPGPNFDPEAYVLAHPELRRSGENPVLHAARRAGALAIARPMQ